ASVIVICCQVIKFPPKNPIIMRLRARPPDGYRGPRPGSLGAYPPSSPKILGTLQWTIWFWPPDVLQPFRLALVPLIGQRLRVPTLVLLFDTERTYLPRRRAPAFGLT